MRALDRLRDVLRQDLLGELHRRLGLGLVLLRMDVGLLLRPGRVLREEALPDLRGHHP